MEHHKMNVGQGLQNTSQTSRVFNPYPSFCSAMQPSLKPLPPSHVGGMTFYQLEEFVDLSLRMMIEEAAVFDNQVKEVNRRDMVIRNNALQLQEVAALFIHFSETVYMLEKEEYFIQYYLGVLELALNSVVEPRSIAPYMSASNDAEL
uniref:Uncharacterized protein n=1 Tax=Timema poppense TaxID=170557 RepID=A0A7R9HA09_TIMPO|nr:unnamed protein product [Timema poppensis]